MKRIIYILIAMFAFNSTTYAQCKYGKEEIIEQLNINNEKNIFIDREVRAESIDKNPINLMLAKESKHVLYLANPSGEMPGIEIKHNSSNKILHEQRHFNEALNIYSYSFYVDHADVYEIMLDFHGEKDACVLFLWGMMFYRPGIYLSFDEFKTDNPSVYLEFPIKSKPFSALIGKDSAEVIYYSFDAKRKEIKDLKNVFGFSDGYDCYIVTSYPKLNARKEFVKLRRESKVPYWLYDYYEYTPIYTENAMVPMYTKIEKLLDSDGISYSLNVNTVKKLIADDEELLNQFLSEKRKKDKLKEYLRLHYERKIERGEIVIKKVRRENMILD